MNWKQGVIIAGIIAGLAVLVYFTAQYASEMLKDLRWFQ